MIARRVAKVQTSIATRLDSPKVATRSSTVMLARSQASRSLSPRATSTTPTSTTRANTAPVKTQPTCRRSTSQSSSRMDLQPKASRERRRICRLELRGRARSSIQTQCTMDPCRIGSGPCLPSALRLRSLRAFRSARMGRRRSSMTFHRATRALRATKLRTITGA